MSRIHFTVLGAGAVGGVVGGLLHRAGLRVTLVARGNHLQALQNEGLRLLTPEWSTVLPVPATRHVPPDTDIVLLAVKAHQVRVLLPDLPKGMPVVCLQNGIGTEPLVARHGHPTIAAMVWMPTVHLQPGEVRSHGHPTPGAIDIGAYTPDAERWVPIVRDALTLAGIQSPAWTDIMALKRTKLLTNLAGPVQAACGDVPDDIWQSLVDEAKAVYDAAGWAYLPLDVLLERGLGVAPVEGVERPGGSTWQSVKRGLAVETPALHEAILEAGRKHGVAMPRLNRLTNIARALDRPEEWSVEALRDALDGASEGEYNAWDITVLDELEPVRKRPGMYVGNGPEAADQLLKNVLDHTLARHLDRQVGRIDVEVSSTRFTVSDDGDGLPGDRVSLECSRLQGMFSVSSLALVNALCRHFEVTSTYEEQCTRHAYRYGEAFETSHPAPGVGMTVVAERDQELIPHAFSLDRSVALVSRINALTSADLEFSINGETLPPETFTQYVARQAGASPTPDLWVKGEHEGVGLEAVIWRANAPAVHAYVNFFYATNGDFIRAIQRMRGEPLVIGIHLSLAQPSFRGMNKDQLTNPEAVAAVEALIGPSLAALAD